MTHSPNNLKGLSAFHHAVVRPERLRDNLLKIAGELRERYAEPGRQITKPRKLPGL